MPSRVPQTRHRAAFFHAARASFVSDVPTEHINKHV